jgi:hypothetical protein
LSARASAPKLCSVSSDGLSSLSCNACCRRDGIDGQKATTHRGGRYRSRVSVRPGRSPPDGRRRVYSAIIAGPLTFANREIFCCGGKNGAASGISLSVSGEGGQLLECLLPGLPAQAEPSRSPPAVKIRRVPRERAKHQPEFLSGEAWGCSSHQAAACFDFSSTFHRLSEGNIHYR